MFCFLERWRRFRKDSGRIELSFETFSSGFEWRWNDFFTAHESKLAFIPVCFISKCFLCAFQKSSKTLNSGLHNYRISQTLNFLEVSSEEEERLLQEHMRLLTEKDAIVRRTEYFNVLERLREVEDEITELQRKLGSASIIDR